MKKTDHEHHIDEARDYWDRQAVSFDDAPDHGLRDPLVRQAWVDLLQESLPSRDGRVLDAGCGTGSLGILLASMGFDVTGIDISPAMIALAQAKAELSGYNIHFHVMDAAHPNLPGEQFDAILCRHLLWALPEPQAVLRRWLSLLTPGGWLVLIEGYWHTGGGLHAAKLAAMMPPSLGHVAVTNLSDQPALWGRPVSDDRYLIKGQK